jgi:hypothetical protein
MMMRSCVSADEVFSENQKEFLMSFFGMVRDSVGLPGPDYGVSKPGAYRLYQALSSPPRQISVNETIREIQANPAGAKSLVYVLLGFGYARGWCRPSLQDIVMSKAKAVEMGGPEFLRVGADFLVRRAIEEFSTEPSPEL